MYCIYPKKESIGDHGKGQSLEKGSQRIGIVLQVDQPTGGYATQPLAAMAGR
jgi:hypothetical protein